MANPNALSVGLGTLVALQNPNAKPANPPTTSQANLNGGLAKSPVFDENRSLRVMIGNVLGNPEWYKEFGKFFEMPTAQNRGVVRDQRGIVEYRLKAAPNSGMQGEVVLRRRDDGRYGLSVNGREVAGVAFVFDPQNNRFFLAEGDQEAIKNALADLKVPANPPATSPPATNPPTTPSFIKPRYRAMQTSSQMSPAESKSEPAKEEIATRSEPQGSLLESLMPILIMSLLASRGGGGGQNASPTTPSIFVV